MKLNILIVCLFIGVSNLFSQQVVMTDSARALEERIKTEGGQAILDAGESGDKSLIPYLKDLDNKMKTPWAKIALAKLGEEKALKDILTDSNSLDENNRARGMDSLVRVGGSFAFKALYLKLTSLKPLSGDLDGSKIRSKGERYEGAYELFSYLKRLVKDPPNADINAGDYWTEQIKLWKAWFANHKELIQ